MRSFTIGASSHSHLPRRVSLFVALSRSTDMSALTVAIGGQADQQ